LVEWAGCLLCALTDCDVRVTRETRGTGGRASPWQSSSKKFQRKPACAGHSRSRRRGSEGEGEAEAHRLHEDQFEEKELHTIFESFPYKDKESVTWLDIVGVHEVDVIGALGKYYNLHPCCSKT